MHEVVKRMLVHTTRRMFHTLYNGKYQEHNQCLRWAGLTVYVFNAMQLLNFIPKSLTIEVQAGAAQWRFKNGSDDTNCFFGYGFSVEELNRHLDDKVSGGNELEWHVWTGIPQTQEILDLTIGHQVTQMRETQNDLPDDSEWCPSCPLPDYLWMSAEEAFDKGWQYTPHIDACIAAKATWAHAITVHDLVSKSQLSTLFRESFASFKP